MPDVGVIGKTKQFAMTLQSTRTQYARMLVEKFLQISPYIKLTHVEEIC